MAGDRTRPIVRIVCEGVKFVKTGARLAPDIRKIIIPQTPWRTLPADYVSPCNRYSAPKTPSFEEADMTLTLEIIGSQTQQLGPAARKEFIRAGGSIGRSLDNEWVIPDPYISGHHARIHFKDGSYLLEDTSTNGVYLKRCGTRLRKGLLHPLESGQQICLDQLEIRISIAPPVPDSTLIKPMREQAASAPAPERTPMPASAGRPSAAEIDDRTELLPPDLILPEAFSPSPAPRHAVKPVKAPPRQTSPDPFATEIMKFPELAKSVERPAPDKLPRTPGPAASNPQRFDAPHPKAAVAAPAAPPSAPIAKLEERFDVAAMLAEAGIPQSAASPELARTMGRVLRTVVAGMLEVLREREELKETLHLQMTAFKKLENNPLKFSANPDDALHNLFVKHNPAYLGPEAAFEQGLRDLRHHQIAVLGALRSSFEAAARNFDPDRLQAQFDNGTAGKTKRSFFGRARYWKQFRTYYRNLFFPTGRFDDRMFADEFARAYSEQVKALHSEADDVSRRKEIHR